MIMLLIIPAFMLLTLAFVAFEISK